MSLSVLLLVTLSSMVQGKLTTDIWRGSKEVIFLIPPITAQSRGELRLARGSTTSYSYTSGRLEIYMNGRWGTICSRSNFGINEATVACKQLGWSGASSYGRSRSLGWVIFTCHAYIHTVRTWHGVNKLVANKLIHIPLVAELLLLLIWRL